MQSPQDASEGHSETLGGYLRSRRSALTPEQVGLPNDRSRRVRGLRREEVAVLAGLSSDYYTKLEQDRAVAPSLQVLNALANALRLGAVERDHLHTLALARNTRTLSETRVHPFAAAVDEVRPSVLRILEALEPTSPAFVIGHRTRLLAYNALGRALHGDPLGQAKPREMVWLLFMDPETRALYPDWADVARDTVGSLRRDAARQPSDPELSRLVTDLADADDDFRRWWNQQHVTRKGPGVKRFTHPIVGELTLQYETLAIDNDAQRLIVYTAAAGSAAEDSLALLGAWSQTRARYPKLGP